MAPRTLCKVQLVPLLSQKVHMVYSFINMLVSKFSLMWLHVTEHNIFIIYYSEQIETFKIVRKFPFIFSKNIKQYVMIKIHTNVILYLT